MTQNNWTGQPVQNIKRKYPDPFDFFLEPITSEL